MDVGDERLLIISNNALSNTRNNGKTIYSYIDCLDKQNVAQLYFSQEYPSISGYKYFRITDRDIIRGMLMTKRRGGPINKLAPQEKKATVSSQKHKGELMRLVREILWVGKWKSRALLSWLDDYAPTAIFFVGGDCLFAYDICKFIAKRYNAKTSLYITDDYIMPRKNDSLIGRLRRFQIKEKIRGCLEYAQSFFTVSEMMRRKYKEIFNKDSSVIVNLSEPMKLSVNREHDGVITMLYAGSLYYGRDDVLGKLSQAIYEYNSKSAKKAILKVYTNSTPDKATQSKFVVKGASEHCGSLDRDELKCELNRSDILVFVESFDESFVEKTKYSLSTKVPEYLSVGKPILAIGPENIGSMDYLSDVAVCVNNISELKDKLEQLIDSEMLQQKVADKCEKKYSLNHSKERMQQALLRKVMNSTNDFDE